MGALSNRIRTRICACERCKVTGNNECAILLASPASHARSHALSLSSLSFSFYGSLVCVYPATSRTLLGDLDVVERERGQLQRASAGSSTHQPTPPSLDTGSPLAVRGDCFKLRFFSCAAGWDTLTSHSQASRSMTCGGQTTNSPSPSPSLSRPSVL